MKKILSFVLVLAMVLGSVSMAFAAERASFPDVYGDESYAEAANVLKAVGVLEGYNDGNFKAERNITRAEAVKLVVVAMGLPVTEGNSYKTVFEDVPEKAWYSGYVYWATTLGITEGTTPTTFRPDQMVTYDQMITFAMRALGYNDNLPGGYPAGYVFKAYTLATADKKDLYNHVPTGSAPATRGDCAEIIYAIMDEYFVQFSKDVSDFQIREYDNGTEKAPETPFERLGCTVGKAKVITDGDIEDSALVDISEFLGAYAHLITKDGNVVGVGKVESVFLTGDNGTKIEGHKVAEKALTGAIYFKNGEEYSQEVKLNDTDKATAVYAVELGSNGTVEKVYSRQTWVDPIHAQVDEDDLEQLNIGDKNESGEYTLLGAEFKLDDDKEIINSSYALEGVKSLAEIAEDNIVYVYLGGNTGKITKVAVGTEVINGRLTKVDPEKNSYTVAGTVYKLADVAETDENDLTLIRGNEINAYLDADGKIYIAEKAEESKTSDVYAVLLAIDKPNTTGTAKNRNNGDMEIVNAKGEQEYIDFATATANNAAQEILGTDAGILVKVTLNSAGKATGVTAAAIDLSGAAISKKGVVDAPSDKYAIGSSAVIFSYSGTKAADKKNAAKYTTISVSKLYGTSAPANTIGFEKSGNITAALIQGDVSNADEDVVVFTAWNFGDGDDLWNVTAYENGAKKDYVFKNSEATKDDPAVNVAVTSAAPTFYTLEFDSNDYIVKANEYKYNTDTKAEITEMPETKTTVSDANVLKIGKKNYELADDVVIYTWTPSNNKNGGSWTISTSSSKLAGLSDKNTSSITLMSEGKDYVYECVIVVKIK